jgi:DNA-directed RNA polymerase subunit RPC12/RpoP
MSIIDRAKSLVTGSEEERFRYQCTSCKEIFESDEAHMGKVSCPQCGDRNVRDFT